MKKLTISLLLSSLAYGQTENQSPKITGTLDASTAIATSPNKSGLSAAIPATCSVGQTYFKTDASAGSNTFACTATNVWTLQGGGGSSLPSQSGNANKLLSSDGTNAVWNSRVDRVYIRPVSCLNPTTYVNGFVNIGAAVIATNCGSTLTAPFLLLNAGSASDGAFVLNLPGWDGTQVDATINWFSSGAATSYAMTYQGGCWAIGGAGVVFNTTQSTNFVQPTAGGGSTNHAAATLLSAVNLTGCSSASDIYIRVTSTPADTLALTSLTVKYNRLNN